MVQLGEHFGRNEVSRHSEWLREQRWFIKSHHEQEKRQEAVEKLDDELLSVATEVVLATDFEIAEFDAKLDIYDEATVKALMENEEGLNRIRVEIEALLSRAYVMEDGRRVFKTEDGAQVFDEFGLEVSPDNLEFEMIGPEYPTWEEFSARKEIQNQLEAERTQILEFQEKVDAARDQISEGEITADELDELDAELANALPPTVRVQIPGFDNSENAPDLQTAFGASNDAKLISNAPLAATASMAAKLDPMG